MNPFALFNAAGLVTKLITIGAAIAAILAIYGIWHHKVYMSGVDDTIAKIARADAATVKRASDARNAFRICRDAGRGWDQLSGTCR